MVLAIENALTIWLAVRPLSKRDAGIDYKGGTIRTMVSSYLLSYIDAALALPRACLGS
jgi:hypothetical protein